MRREARSIDLVNELGLTFALLDNPRAWRERAVHEIVLQDSDHVRATTAYQIRLPLDLARRYVPEAEPSDLVRLLLPFTVRSNQLLINVDFKEKQGISTTLLLRREIAGIQAAYMAHMVNRWANSDNGQGGDNALRYALWEGVSAYTTWDWREHRARSKPPVWKRPWRGFEISWRTRALADYLNADLDLNIQPSHVTAWLERVEPARLALVEALGEGESSESSSECVLLAIPFMPLRPRGIADIDIVVSEFCTAVAEMDEEAQRVLAEYGRRWEAVIETIVPVEQACTVKLMEQRPWIGAPSPKLKQELVFGDAVTTHVEIRTTDHNVEIHRPRISDLAGDRRGYSVADAIRETTDAIAIYAANPERPYSARVEARARIRWGHRLPFMWLLIFIAGAGAVAIELPANGNLVNSLGLLTLPLTLAGAVVLSREATSLAERLLRRWRASLVLAMAALWIVTLSRLLLNADVHWAQSAWSRVSNLMGG